MIVVSYISLTTNMRLKRRKAKFEYNTSFMGTTAVSPKGKYMLPNVMMLFHDLVAGHGLFGKSVKQEEPC